MAAFNPGRRITLPPMQAVQDHYEYYDNTNPRETPPHSRPTASTNPYSQALPHTTSNYRAANSRAEYHRHQDHHNDSYIPQDYRPRSEEHHSQPQQQHFEQQLHQQQNQHHHQYHHHHDEREIEHNTIRNDIKDSSPTNGENSSRENRNDVDDALENSSPRSYKDVNTTNSTICRPFITKLAFLLESSSKYGDVLEWNETGTAFVITLCDKLTSTILPEIFSHKSVAAFHRQLTTYGFFHLSPSQLASQFANNLTSTAGTLIRQRSGWSHPYFTRDREEDRTKLVPRPSRARAEKQLAKALLWSAKTNAETTKVGKVDRISKRGH